MTEAQTPRDRAGAPPAGAEVELFRSPHLRVRQVGRDRHAALVVTFACFHDVPDVEAPGFGEAFLRARGIDAVHVTCAGNDWYQYREWKAALLRIREAARPYARVLAYGSSMGGYAAVRFGALAGAQDALAISPQFSIDRRLAPFERRWRGPASAIRFLYEDEPVAIPHATIAYDPLHVDRRHADLIAAAIPATRVRLPHAGHPAGAYLAETGCLPDLVLACCRGGPGGEFERRARAARRRSGQYLFTLARKLPRRRLATKLALARRAVAAVPREPTYHSYLGVVLEASGEVAAAEASHRRAAELGPGAALCQARLARLLLRAGRADEAATAARAFQALQPGDAKARALLAAASLAAGGVTARTARLAAALASPVDAALLLAWRATGTGWRLRGLGLRRDRLPLRLGAPDEMRSADIAPGAS